MTVKEYLNLIGFFKGGKKATFIKARARKDAQSPYYHSEYQTTPMYDDNDLREDNKLLDYIVLNNKQPPIDWLSGAEWANWYNKGELISLLVISKEDLETLYSPKQAAGMVEYIDKVIKETV